MFTGHGCVRKSDEGMNLAKSPGRRRVLDAAMNHITTKDDKTSIGHENAFRQRRPNHALLFSG